MYGLQSLCVADDDQTDNCSKLPEDTDVSDDEEVIEEHEKTELQIYGDTWAEVYEDYIAGEYDDLLRREPILSADDIPF